MKISKFAYLGNCIDVSAIKELHFKWWLEILPVNILSELYGTWTSEISENFQISGIV